MSYFLGALFFFFSFQGVESLAQPTDEQIEGLLAYRYRLDGYLTFTEFTLRQRLRCLKKHPLARSLIGEWKDSDPDCYNFINEEIVKEIYKDYVNLRVFSAFLARGEGGHPVRDPKEVISFSSRQVHTGPIEFKYISPAEFESESSVTQIGLTDKEFLRAKRRYENFVYYRCRELKEKPLPERSLLKYLVIKKKDSWDCEPLRIVFEGQTPSAEESKSGDATQFKSQDLASFYRQKGASTLISSLGRSLRADYEDNFINEIREEYVKILERRPYLIFISSPKAFKVELPMAMEKSYFALSKFWNERAASEKRIGLNDKIMAHQYRQLGELDLTELGDFLAKDLQYKYFFELFKNYNTGPHKNDFLAMNEVYDGWRTALAWGKGIFLAGSFAVCVFPPARLIKVFEFLKEIGALYFALRSGSISRHVAGMICGVSLLTPTQIVFTMDAIEASALARDLFLLQGADSNFLMDMKSLDEAESDRFMNLLALSLDILPFVGLQKVFSFFSFRTRSQLQLKEAIHRTQKYRARARIEKRAGQSFDQEDSIF